MSIFTVKATGENYLPIIQQSPDAAEIRRAVLLLADRERGCQLQGIPDGRCFVLPGRDTEGLVSAALTLADSSRVQITVNPVDRQLAQAARAGDILYRRWFLIGVDAVRENPSKTNATELEKANAQEVVTDVWDYLAERHNWPLPVVIDSGNGFHMLWRIDEENTEEVREMLGRAVLAIATQFSGERAYVEKDTHAAVVRSRLPGTWNRSKGQHTTERPWRLCRIVAQPNPVEVVSHEQIATVAALAPERRKRTSGAAPELELPPPRSIWIVTAHDPEAAYARGAMQSECGKMLLTPPGERNGQLFRSAAALGNFVAGGWLTEQDVTETLYRAALGAGCDDPIKDRLTIKRGLAEGIKTAREIPARPVATPTGNAGDGKPVARPKVEIVCMTKLLAMDLPAPQWAVPGLLCEGLTILAGKPKLGKSWLAMNLGLTIAAGGTVLGDVEVEEGAVLYLALEDRLRRVQDRARKIIRHMPPSCFDNLGVCVACPRQDQGGLDAIQEWAAAARKPRLVIIDVWAKFRPPVKSQKSAYDQDYEHVSQLKGLIDRLGVSCLVIHHCKKAPSEDAQDDISGTLGFAGGADGSLVLARNRGENGAVLHVSGRDVEEKKLSLTFDPEKFSWSNNGDAEEQETGDVRKAILDTLRKMRAPMTAIEIAEASGKKPPCVRMACLRMAGEGKIVKVGLKYTLKPESEERF